MAAPSGRSFVAGAALGLVAATSCTGVASWRPTLGAAYTAAEDFDAEVSGLGYTFEGETDYESFELILGSTAFEEDGSKSGRAEARLGAAEFFELDAIEFSGGGRIHLGGGRVSPYVALHAVTTFFDDVEGFDVGTQLGLRAGGGVELGIGEHFFVDVGLDYTVPLIAAEDETGFVETEVEGLAVRIGAGFML